MATIKIQINNEKPIFKRQLTSILYDQIGEEYGLSEDEIKDYFEISSIILLPNNTFVTVLTFELPELETRDIELKDIVFSFLDSVEKIDGVLNILKTQDSILQTKADEIYKIIASLEMELRNVLTYIITYDEKKINDELFKTFETKRSENIDYPNLKQKYENGLFYIYFDSYASFSEPKKLKSEKILEFLQAPSIDTFEKFKIQLRDRGIRENRHLDFIASIKTKLDPVEKMRNAIMHIRNLSDNLVKNFEMAIGDENSKGIQTLIDEFWASEHDELKQKTFFKIIESTIENLFETSHFQDAKLILTQDFGDEILSEYESVDELQNDFILYCKDELDFNYVLTDEDEEKIKEKITEKWNIFQSSNIVISTDE